MSAVLKPAPPGVDLQSASAAGAALRAFFRLAEAWGMSVAEQTIVLGIARGGLVLAASLAYGARVLVVDDVADSGKTLELVLDFCRGHVAEARSAVLYQKPTSLLEPDFVWRHTVRWIDFPWSSVS